MSLDLEAAFKKLLSSDAGKYIEPRELAPKLLFRNHITSNEYEQIMEWRGTREQRQEKLFLDILMRKDPEETLHQLMKCSVELEWITVKNWLMQRYEFLQEPPNNEQIEIEEIPASQINLSKVISHGHFGIIYEALLRIKNTEKIVAAKKLSTNYENIRKEAQTLILLKHPNIIEFIGISATENGLPLLLMELLPIDLNQKLTLLNEKSAAEKQESILPLLKIMHDVASGMVYLGSKGLVHRDLAARNVLLTSDILQDAVAKLCDFGMCRNTVHSLYYGVKDNSTIPMAWSAPEVLEWCRDLKTMRAESAPVKVKISYSLYREDTSFTFSRKNSRHFTASDVWSYGVLLWETVTFGATPFNYCTTKQIVQTVLMDKKTLDIPEHIFPTKVTEIIKQSWSFYPEKRPTFHHIIDVLQAEIQLQMLNSKKKMTNNLEHPRIPTAGKRMELKEENATIDGPQRAVAAMKIHESSVHSDDGSDDSGLVVVSNDSKTHPKKNSEAAHTSKNVVKKPVERKESMKKKTSSKQKKQAKQ